MSLSQKENQPINQPMRYCWWKKSGDHQLIDSLYHYLHGFSYISAGFFPDFLPPTVAWYRWDKAIFSIHMRRCIWPQCVKLAAPYHWEDTTWQVVLWIQLTMNLQVATFEQNTFQPDQVMTNKKIIQWHWTKYTLEMITRHIRLKTAWEKLFTDGIEKNSHGYVGIYKNDHS